jgi:hypothetical protein
MAKAENTKPSANKIQSGKKDVIGKGNSIVNSRKKRKAAIRIVSR